MNIHPESAHKGWCYRSRRSTSSFGDACGWKNAPALEIRAQWHPHVARRASWCDCFSRAAHEDVEDEDTDTDRGGLN